VVLPNRQIDNKAGGSGAAGQRIGQRHGRAAAPHQMQGNTMSDVSCFCQTISSFVIPDPVFMIS
jgi:hypothetical protein